MRYCLRILVLCTVGMVLFPVYSVLVNALIQPAAITQAYQYAPYQLLLWPSPFSLSQFSQVFASTSVFWRPFFISLAISVPGVLAHLCVAPLVAYLFAFARYRGIQQVFFLYIVAMLAPFQVTLLPNFLFAKFIGIHGTYWAVLLPLIFAPFGVFFLRQMMSAIPSDILDAAMLDTTNPCRILYSIVCPYIKPGLIALGVIQFAECWGMVEQPLIMLRRSNQYPLSLALEGIAKGNSIGIAFACSVLAMSPMLALYFATRRSLISNLHWLG